MYQGDGVLIGLLKLGHPELAPSSCLEGEDKMDRETPRRSANPTGSTLATFTSQGSTMDSSTFCVVEQRRDNDQRELMSSAGVEGDDDG